MKKLFLFSFSLFLDSLCFAQSEVIVGDMNQDGKITVEDVSMLADDLLKGKVRRYNSDCTITYGDHNLLPGKFSVSATKQVRFTRGNLYYSTTDNAYHLEPEQNVTYVTLGQSAYDATHVCHFYWSNITDWQTSGMEPWGSSYSYSSVSKSDKFFCGEDNKMEVDGTDGLYALTGYSTGEFYYLFNTRANASSLYKCNVTVTTSAGTVDDCIVIAPDDYTGTISGSYTADEWKVAESEGLVCIPAAGTRRPGNSLIYGGSMGRYWSASPNTGNAFSAFGINFTTSLNSNYWLNRSEGFSIRLVRDY